MDKKQIGNVLVIVLLLTLPFIQVACATTSLIGSDNDADLYEFDYNYLEDVVDDLDVDGLDIDSANDIYDKLDEKKDETRDNGRAYAERTGSPDKMDILTIDFDLETFEIIITMADEQVNDYEDREMTLGVIWSDEHIFLIVLYEDFEYYYNLNNDSYDELGIDDEKGTITFYSDEEDFNDEEYVRAMFIYYEDITERDEAVIDFFSNEFEIESLEWIFWLILILMILIVVILVIILLVRRYQ